MVFPVCSGFSTSYVQLWELDHKEGWGLKNWCLQIVMLEKTLENPLDCKKIQPVNPKGNQPRIFTGRTDAEAEALLFWSPDTQNQLIRKDPEAGKDWGQEKGETEDEMLYSNTVSTGMNLNKLWEMLEDRGAWCAAIHGFSKSRTQLSNCTKTTKCKMLWRSRGIHVLFSELGKKEKATQYLRPGGVWKIEGEKTTVSKNKVFQKNWFFCCHLEWAKLQL